MPFTQTQFLEVFAAYNRAIYPLQWLLVAMALVMIGLALGRRPAFDRAVAGLLALLWLWTGLGYHLAFFSRINPLAIGFALLCLVQAGLFAWQGLRQAPAFRPAANVRGFTGAALMLYALVIYPWLGQALGHHYPFAPTFGAPCPATIFSLGLLLWSDCSLRLLVIPLLWSLIGGSAVLAFGMYEDFGLLLAGLLTLGFHLVAPALNTLGARSVHRL